MKALLALSFMLVGCGAPPELTDSMPVIEEPYQTYVDRFVAEAAARGVTVNVEGLSIIGRESITHYENSPNVAAVCFHKTNVIEVLTSYWAKVGEVVRERMIFHELGHCVLKRGHRKIQVATPQGSYYGSLMEPALFSGYPELRPYYLDELFGKI